MAEQNQTDDRWRELADLLGLPGDGPAPAKEPAPAPPVKAEVPPRAPREVEEERPMPHFTHEARLEPMAEETQPPEWESEFDEGDDDTAIDDSLLRDEPAGEEFVEIESEEFVEAGGEEPVEGGAPVSEEDKPRRGRRRRRRGRRGGREGEDRPERAAQGSEPRRQPDPEPRERGRGDRRRDEEPRRAAPPRQERREPVPVEADEDTRPKPRRPWKPTMTPISATGMCPAGRI